MNQLDKILYAVATGMIGPQVRKEYNSFSPDQNDQQLSLRTADELMNDFSKDEYDARNRYNDTVVRVSGIIKSIQQSQSTQIILLSTSSASCSIICHFTKTHNGQFNRLRPWQPIVVRGVCVGILKHVVLENCELDDR